MQQSLCSSVTGALPIMLQVSTSDGRVRIIGTEGVERTLHSASKLPHATKQLAFLYNRGVILRVCDVSGWGCLEVFSGQNVMCAFSSTTS